MKEKPSSDEDYIISAALIKRLEENSHEDFIHEFSSYTELFRPAPLLEEAGRMIKPDCRSVIGEHFESHFPDAFIGSPSERVGKEIAADARAPA